MSFMTERDLNLDIPVPNLAVSPDTLAFNNCAMLTIFQDGTFYSDSDNTWVSVHTKKGSVGNVGLRSW